LGAALGAVLDVVLRRRLALVPDVRAPMIVYSFRGHRLARSGQLAVCLSLAFHFLAPGRVRILAIALANIARDRGEPDPVRGLRRRRFHL
jgi:hypothetical protein